VGDMNDWVAFFIGLGLGLLFGSAIALSMQARSFAEAAKRLMSDLPPGESYSLVITVGHNSDDGDDGDDDPTHPLPEPAFQDYRNN